MTDPKHQSLTFDLCSSEDYLHDLQQRVDDFMKDGLDQRKAMDCAVSAWHAWDWIYSQHGCRLGYETLGHLQEQTRKQCPEFGYLQDIANARKHRFITKYPSRLKDAKMHPGAYSRDFRSCL